jgi:uncharacterized protein
VDRNDWYRYDAGRNVLTLNLHVQPNAGRSGFAGLHGKALKVRIAAPAVEDKANALLIDFLRKTFRLGAGSVIITHGSRWRAKTVEIAGAGPDLIARLGALADQ